MELGDLEPGMRIGGLDPAGMVAIDRVDVMGPAATLHYTDHTGTPQQRMVFAADLASFEVERPPEGPTFDADPADFRLACEALRIRYAAAFDRLLAVHASAVEPLPHQIKAVYEEMLPRRPLRFLLADDPGAGKTIMAGLYIKEVLARRLARRILVVAPGSLVEQWQQELAIKFGLPFQVFHRAMHDEADGGNAFAVHDLLICRVDQLARDRALQEQLAATTWDLSIVDEAHKMTARWWGSKVMKSKRYELGERLGRISANFLLMTATPHSGKEADFQLFMSLLDEDRFVGRPQDHPERPDAGDLMRRLVKEQLRHADGRPLFPERIASTVPYELTPLEMELYEEVSEYVRTEMNKTSGDERRTVGFALLVLQRRVASSPEAALQSLRRRRDTLQEQADNAEAAERSLEHLLRQSLDIVPPEDEDDLLSHEREQLEDRAAVGGSASRTLGELLTEIGILNGLVELAERVRGAGVDRKWEELAKLLTSSGMYDDEGRRRKIIIFTEHRDTLAYLEDRIVGLLGSGHHVVTIHGGTSPGDRRLAQEAFLEEPDVSVLLATDAAGEGVNLQKANLMVNYDLPWNPNRLEQRFGRIHRIGQTRVCHLWNLVATGTREGDVMTTLLVKLEAQREALGDKVFDVLGEVLSGSELTELLSEAIQYGDRPEVRARLHETLELRVGADLDRAISERAASVSELTDEDLFALRCRMAAARAVKVQPHAVEDFVRVALPRARGELVDVGGGRVRIPRLGEELRDKAAGLGGGRVARRYDAATFEVEALYQHGRDPAELLAPGHPLVDALADATLDDVGPTLKRGAVLVDQSVVGEWLVVIVSVMARIAGTDEPLLEDLVAVRTTGAGEVEEVRPTYLLACPPADDNPPMAEESIAAARQAADRWLEEVAEPRMKEQLVRQLVGQRASALEVVRSRLGTEIRRMRERIEALEGDPDHEPAVLAELRRIEAGMGRRLAEREQSLTAAADDLEVRCEVLAVATVKGTGHRTPRKFEADGGDEVVVHQMPGSGFDVLVVRRSGEATYVKTLPGEDLMTELVRRNVGQQLHA